MTSAAGAVNAQAGGLLNNTTGTVKDTAGGVKDTAQNTVQNTTGTVTGTTGSVTGTAGSAVGSVTGSGGGGGSTGTSGSTGTTIPSTTTTPTTTTTTTTTTTGGSTGTTGGSGSATGGAAGPGGPQGTGGNVRGGRGGSSGRNGGTAMPPHPMAIPHQPEQQPNGVPTKFNPSLSVATPNPSPFGPPSFMVGQFEIPPFLLPIYQACGTQYGIPWEVLASINKIETAFGTNLNVSTAGAEGWMQFMPATWKTWGIDANGDGRADPYNPVDAICSAGRYLQASGGETNLRQAIFAYNHASWYVDEVLLTAQQYGRLPDELVGSLTGLTMGDRFPIAAKSRYAEPAGDAPIYAAKGSGGGPNRAIANFGRGPVHLNPGVNMEVGQEPQIEEALSALAAEIGKPVYVISGYRSPAHSVAVGGFADDPHTKGIAADIGVGAPTRDSVASVTDAQLRAVGLFRPFSAPSEINHVQLLYGAASTSGSAQGINIFSREGAPVVAANDGTIKAIGHSRDLGNYIVLKDDYGNKFIYWQLGSIRPAKGELSKKRHRGKQESRHDQAGSSTKQAGSKSKQQSSKNSKSNRRRLYALPQRRHNITRARLFGQLQPDLLTAAPNDMGPLNRSRPQRTARALHRGSRVSAGTLLGRVGKTDGLAPHINFAIQPTGIGNGSVDPKPILDGWQLLHETAAYSSGQNPLRSVAKPSDAINDLLMPSSALANRALRDPRLAIYRCGRMDIRRGQIDRRVLATINFLADNGFRLSISSLKCDAHDGSGSASQIGAEHSSGDAVAISKVDGVPVAGRQGRGTPADALIKTVLGQQGVMEPDQVTSHEDLPGPVSSSLSGKRGDRIDIGFTPLKSDSTYQSPFEHAVKGRIDMGVDYVGQGPINAIGNARILRIGAPGWPNGGAGPAGQGVLYKLLDGPQQGSIIYVYEGVRPTVQAGDEVVAGQQIATFYPGSSIEIGFSDAAGAPLAHDIYTEGMVTSWGRKMDTFLSSVGAPGRLNHQFSQMLSPQEWSRLIQQMRHISNPTVRPSPSRSGSPARSHTGGPSGPTGPGP